jgi:ribosomal protein S27AE
MQTKKYTQGSALIQWAYLFEEVRPMKTSTCAVFWRSVLVTPLKILGPTVIALGVGAMLFSGVASAFFTEWASRTLPSWAFVQPSPVSTPINWWPPVGLFAAYAVVIVGHLLGVWQWLHGFCIPIEIEGGLVKRGSCPECVGTMIEVSERRWECRKCGGAFEPPAAADAAGQP